MFLFHPLVVATVIQSLSSVWLFATPWTAACQAPLSSTSSWSLLSFMSIELMMLSISSSAAPFSFCLQSFPPLVRWLYPHNTFTCIVLWGPSTYTCWYIYILTKFTKLLFQGGTVWLSIWCLQMLANACMDEWMRWPSFSYFDLMPIHTHIHTRRLSWLIGSCLRLKGTDLLPCVTSRLSSQQRA